MTDREKLVALLTEWAVPFWDGPISVLVGLQETEDSFDSPKVTGYPGFATAFEFTPDGTFVTMGAWE